MATATPACATSMSAIGPEYDLVAYRGSFVAFPFQATQAGKPYRLDVVTLDFVVKSEVIVPTPTPTFTPDPDALFYATTANGKLIYTDTINGLFIVEMQPTDIPATPQGLLDWPEGAMLNWAVRQVGMGIVMAAGHFYVFTSASIGG